MVCWNSNETKGMPLTAARRETNGRSRLVPDPRKQTAKRPETCFFDVRENIRIRKKDQLAHAPQHRAGPPSPHAASQRCRSPPLECFENMNVSTPLSTKRRSHQFIL